MTLLAEELGLGHGHGPLLSTSALNRLENAHNRIDEIVNFIHSNDSIKFFVVKEAPLDEDLGRRFSQAIVSSPPHIVKFVLGTSADMRDLIPWIGAGRGTLARTTSLSTILMLFFSLLLTSTSLQELDMYFHFQMTLVDESAFTSALRHYLSGTTSLVHFSLRTQKLSQVAFLSLCDGIAESSLRKLTLWIGIARDANLEVVAERLALAITESSLDEVAVEKQLFLALLHVPSVRNLFLVFNLIATRNGSLMRLKINHKWKPLLTADVPLGLWPHIMYKAHALPETSHGPAGMIYSLLIEKPELVPAASNSSR